VAIAGKSGQAGGDHHRFVDPRARALIEVAQEPAGETPYFGNEKTPPGASGPGEQLESPCHQVVALAPRGRLSDEQVAALETRRLSFERIWG
jgi:hypothetical protein